VVKLSAIPVRMMGSRQAQGPGLGHDGPGCGSEGRGTVSEGANLGTSEVTYPRDVVPRSDPLLGKVVRLADRPGLDMAAVTGNPHDQGTDWALLGPLINGAREFSVGVFTMTPNQVHPPHYHPVGPEFYYIVSGSCLVRVDDDEVEVGPETAIYLPEGTVHAVRTRDGETVTIFYGFDERADAAISTVWLE
jgi:quercetin dioxygenase-like cupin family protein